MGENSAKKSVFSLDSDDECNQDENSAILKSLETPQSSGNASLNSEISGNTDGSFEEQESLIEDESEKQNPQSSNVSAETQSNLTAFQKAKIERNRQKALLLRQARLKAHPYKKYLI